MYLGHCLKISRFLMPPLKQLLWPQIRILELQNILFLFLIIKPSVFSHKTTYSLMGVSGYPTPFRRKPKFFLMKVYLRLSLIGLVVFELGV